MKFLHIEFNEVKFDIYAEETVLDLIKCYWQLTLCNVMYRSDSMDNAWKIRVDVGNEEKTVIDKERKNIYYKVREKGYINSINSLIREFIVKTSLAKGYVWLHASAFAVDNKGTLVIGKKGDGKTTQLLNSCYNHGAQVIGNDQIPLIFKDGKLLTYRWRPDVKLSPLSLQVIGLEDNIDTDVERLMWMPQKEQLSALDCKDLSERRHQKIIPYSTSKIKLADSFEYEITRILFLSENHPPLIKEVDSEVKKKLFQELFEKDDENINSEKFINWTKEIPYWNKRIIGLNLEEGALRKESSTISYMENNVKGYRVYKRIDFNNEHLRQILRE